jgi:hypothetical protein
MNKSQTCLYYSAIFDGKKKTEGETKEMFDVTTMALTGMGGASLFAAFLEYRFSRKRKTEAKAHA